MTRTDEPLGLYIHVPFCASRCPYCDFYSHCDKALIPACADALCDESRTLRRTAGAVDISGVRNRTVTSVYFGGGTPSLLAGEQVGSILRTVRKTYDLSPEAEITLEANPSLPEPERFFAQIAEAGVNRVSLGLQSAVDAERKKLGRRSGRAEIERCLASARAAGIENLSLDVMLGIPGQTEETLRETLDFVIESGAPHVSAYLLKIEPGTVFYKKRETLDLPDEDAAADLYLFTCAYLKQNGFRHYEISNFCKNDLVGRHNLGYWQDKEYLGLGPGAHGFLGGVRYRQPPEIDGFLRGAPCEVTDTGGDAAEAFMLAMRLDTGVAPEAFAKRFGARFLPGFEKKTKFFAEKGLLTAQNGTVALTDAGMLLSNAVIAELLAQIETIN